MSDFQIQTLTGHELLEISANNPDKRYELIEGELIEMPPPSFDHGKYENLLAYFLTDFVRKNKVGTVLVGEAGFYTRGDKKTVRMADVAYISYEKAPRDVERPGYSELVPDIVVEIISPSETATKIDEKVNEWLDFGVSLVWIVYPKTKHVHVFTPERTGTILRSDDSLTGGKVLNGFEVPISDLFDV